MGPPAIAALLLLLAILCIAAVAPRWTAICASVAAAFVLNFFFLPPVGTLAIADPHSWIVWLVFVAVSLLGSHADWCTRISDYPTTMVG